jgi:hypothetical protein
VFVNSWRVTKYDPRLRDAEGRYTRDEWTSYAQVGRVFGGKRLTLSAYEAVEVAYVSAVSDFAVASGVRSLRATGVECASKRAPKGLPFRVVAGADSKPFGVESLGAVARACLREEFWCRVVGVNEPFFAHFGWDYYLYLGSSLPCKEAIERARQRGLFVEAFASPYIE